jgi:hypothetical protein
MSISRFECSDITNRNEKPQYFNARSRLFALLSGGVLAGAWAPACGGESFSTEEGNGGVYSVGRSGAESGSQAGAGAYAGSISVWGGTPSVGGRPAGGIGNSVNQGGLAATGGIETGGGGGTETGGSGGTETGGSGGTETGGSGGTETGGSGSGGNPFDCNTVWPNKNTYDLGTNLGYKLSSCNSTDCSPASLPQDDFNYNYTSYTMANSPSDRTYVLQIIEKDASAVGEVTIARKDIEFVCGLAGRAVCNQDQFAENSDSRLLAIASDPDATPVTNTEVGELSFTFPDGYKSCYIVHEHNND